MSASGHAAVGFVLLAMSFAAASASPVKGTVAEAPASARAASGVVRAASGAAALAPSSPVAFSGTLVTGTTYVADMAYDGRALHVWRPVKDVVVAKDVAWTIAWTNLDQFPALKTAAAQSRPQRFRFRVAKTEMLSGSPQLPWTVTYQCEILAVDPVPQAAPAAPPGGSRR